MLQSRPWRAVLTAAASVRGVFRRQFITSNRRLAFVLALAVVGIGIAVVHVSASWFSPGLMILPVLAGGLLLWPRALRVLFVIVALTLAYDVARADERTGFGIVATIAIMAVFADVLARTRAKLGLQGLRGDQLLIELRDRIKVHSALPPLPAGWGAEWVLRPAGGALFGGDFVVSACDGKTLEVAVVDVSGKGIDAGTRALLLSGAFGGLLGSVPASEFLGACNTYLRRSEPAEGFVTAVHLALDLMSGNYVLSSAGHPPAVHFEGGSGTWRLTGARGIVLGVVPDLRGVPERSMLRPGDALMLYTDGLIEQPGRDIDIGIDRLVGAADRLVAAGFRGGAANLVQALQADGATDDCALVLIWRTPAQGPGQRLAEARGGVLDQGHEHVAARRPLPRIEEQQRDVRGQVQRAPQRRQRVAPGVVEAVHRDDERQPGPLEVVDRGETVREAPGIGHDHRTKRAVGQFVPHEPEAALPRRAEQVENQVIGDRDPAEVHRHRGGGLAFHALELIGYRARFGQVLLGAQRAHLTHRADQGSLPDAEAARDEDLDGDGSQFGDLAGIAVQGRGLRVCGAHRPLP
jgi:hypothetical protein